LNSFFSEFEMTTSSQPIDADLVSVSLRPINRMPTKTKYSLTSPGVQQLVFNQRLPILSHVKTLFQTGILVPIKTRQAPALPIPLVDQNTKTKKVLHISLDPNIKPFIDTHKIVATSSSLRSLLHPNTVIQLTVVDGVKYIGKRVNRRVEASKRIGNTYLKNYLDSSESDIDPIYLYNSWGLEGKQICVRHRSDCLVREVGTLSFKTRPTGVNPLLSKISELTRVDLWLHTYLRGQNTIVLGSISNTELTHLDYVNMIDLVGSDGAQVAPFMHRLDAIIEFIGTRVVEDGVYCLKIGERDCSVYRMGEGAGKETGKGSFEDMLDQLEF
jgi:hypothetical protein